MKDKQLYTFAISAILFALIIVGASYAAGTDITAFKTISAGLFGGIVGLLATTPKTSFLKNIIFIAAFTWLIWAAFTPIQTVGDSWIINKPALFLGLTIFIIFTEREFWNIFRRMKNKPGKAGIGLLGTIMILIFMSQTGITGAITSFISEHLIYAIIFLIIWWGILYVFIKKQLKKGSDSLVKMLNRGR